MKKRSISEHVQDLRDAFAAKFKISACITDGKGTENYSPVYVRALEARYERHVEGLARIEKINAGNPHLVKILAKV